METDLPLEVIGGYKVHPAASLFPLLEGEDFTDLVESIKTYGLMHPIIVKGMSLSTEGTGSEQLEKRISLGK